MSRPNKTRSKVWESRLDADGPLSFEEADAGTSTPASSVDRFTDVAWRSDPGSIHNYKRLIRDHVSATSILQGTILQVVRTKTRGSFTGTYNGIRNQMFVDIPYTMRYNGYTPYTRIKGYPAIVTCSSDIAEREASKKFYRKVKEVQQAMQGLVFIGELRQTLKMLRNPAQALFNSARNDYLAKLSRLKSTDRNWFRGLRSTYLEAFYGWLPFISDIKAASDVLLRLPFEPTTATLITAVGRDTEKFARSVNVTGDVNRCVFIGTRDTYAQRKVKYRGLYLRERNGGREVAAYGEGAAALVGFEWREFVPTLWELLPWSFLVDYFSNVGDILEMSFVNLESVRWVNRTQIDDSVEFTLSNLDIEGTRSNNTWAGHKFTGASRGDDSVLLLKRRSFVREPHFPRVPSLTLELPGSPQKWLAMGALWSQANDIHPQRFKFKGR